MSLSSLQLDAFYEVARSGSFSKAARKLNITQSALSQRVLNLEDELGAALIIRESSGLKLTETGQDLFRYCQRREGLESEFTGRLNEAQSQGKLLGTIRIAGYSTVMRSVAMPSLTDLMALNPGIKVEILNRELRDLSSLLRTGEADLLLHARESESEGVETKLLGYEENVLVSSSDIKKDRENVFLDHDPEDSTTLDFFRLQGNAKPQIQRSYLDDIYGILDGVKLGWGKAVVPRHLVENEPKLRIARNYKALKIPVRLHYYRQAYYSRLFEAVREALIKNAPDHLS